MRKFNKDFRKVLSLHSQNFNMVSLRSLPAIIFASLACVTGGCTDSGKYSKVQGGVWNTLYSVTYRGDEPWVADSISGVLAETGRSVSAFDSASLISRVNRNETDSLDPALLTILQASVRINHETEGMFDPTGAPLFDAWGFGIGHSVSGDTARIDSLLQFVGIDKVKISENRITKDDPRLRFNLSAIAKGYGSDAIGAMLRRNGITDYLVEIGGEISVSGRGSGGKPWRIGIDIPETSYSGNEKGVAKIISVTDCGLATSGNYRNFHEENGHRFGHTINPITGRPIETDVLSATVIAPTCMEADAYATALMVMGSEKATQFAESIGLPVLLILGDSSIYENSDFKAYLKD